MAYLKRFFAGWVGFSVAFMIFAPASAVAAVATKVATAADVELLIQAQAQIHTQVQVQAQAQTQVQDFFIPNAVSAAVSSVVSPDISSDIATGASFDASFGASTGVPFAVYEPDVVDARDVLKASETGETNTENLPMNLPMVLSHEALAELAYRKQHPRGGRNIEDGYYRKPLDMTLLLSANFAEARADHLHSGIDIKTAAVEGKPLYAVADGYIARINIAPWGYGRALYIAHPNGTTSVYAHMQKFADNVEKFVDNQRYRAKKHNGDFYYEQDAAAARFRVKKGDYIGNAGNSGSSTGPHLHFEIRETASQRTYNVGAMGVYDLTDDIPPMMLKLHYIALDTVRGVPMDAETRTFALKNTDRGAYSLADTAALELSPAGYFVLEVTDRKNNTNNTMGVYSVRMWIDDLPHFSFALDSFLFSENRYVNSLTHYAMQRGSRNELLRLAVQPMNKLPVYYGVRDRGAVVLRDEELHAVRIVAEDDNGNISEVGFRVKRAGRTAQASVNEQTSVNAQAAGMQADGMQADGTPADCRRQFSYSMDGASVTIPAGALYESILYKQSSQEVAQPRMKHYSPVYTLHNDNVPLHQAITIAIDVADVPDAVKPKLCLARIAADGRYRYAAAKHEGGRVSGKVRAFGRYVVVADKTPPVIKPSFSEGADLTGAKSISLTLSDNFSGVPSFSATIDGQWIAFEQRGNTITHFFNPERISYNGAAHTLKITATDSKGNSATLTRKFVR